MHVALSFFQQWQGLIVGFREGMPQHRRRVKMRQYEECFTGGEAVQWLHGYLRESGSFGTVSKQQVPPLRGACAACSVCVYTYVQHKYTALVRGGIIIRPN